MSHPYTEFENTKLWRVIDAAVTDLEKNCDVKLLTAREYVIGSLCKQLVSSKAVAEDSVIKIRSNSN
jgi:hypothetical protein